MAGCGTHTSQALARAGRPAGPFIIMCVIATTARRPSNQSAVMAHSPLTQRGQKQRNYWGLSLAGPIHLRRRCQAKAFQLRLPAILSASAHRLSQTPSERPCATSATIPYPCPPCALCRSTGAKSQPSLATSRLVLAQPPATVPAVLSLPSSLGAFRKG